MHALPIDASPRCVVPLDARYPAALHDLPDPPAAIHLLGSLELLERPVVAIVGTRRATPYGERVTRELAGALARAGACVLSGMARGIDGMAHRAALDAGGATAAVLGTGIDVPYPARHRALHAQIAQHGLLLSEFPSGTRAFRGCFPRRNRLIAALAPLTIVVEAGFGSGAMLTAKAALDLGRTVAAVPGPIDSPQSAESNRLLRDGAQVICDAADALALAGLDVPHFRSQSAAALPADGDERCVWDALADGNASLDVLTTRTRLPANRCLAAVTTLEVSGLVECRLTGEIARRR